MKELIIHDNEAGQRLDKLLRKYLSEAPGSFIYKMLRKKNIVLNGKKATGNEHLKKGDSVKLFLADDTIAKFQAAGKTVEESIKNTVKLDVIYEDQNVIFINKPSGMLSQKAKETDVSVVENVTAYLLESGQLLERIPRFIATQLDDCGELQRFRAHRLRVIHKHLANYVFDEVRHVINLLQEEDDILAFNGSNELLGELLHELVLVDIRFVLDDVNLVNLLCKLDRIEVLN